MTQPPPPPLTLEYQTPPSGPPSPTRKKVSLHARGNGTGCVVLSLCFGASFTGVAGLLSRNPFNLLALVICAVVGLYAMAYFACGIIYIIASVMIRKPNVLWERILVLTSSIHIVIVLLMLLVSLMSAGIQNRVDALMILGFLIDLVIIIALAQMIQLVRKVHRLGE